MSGRILITGGLGYIGGRLSRYLSENNPGPIRIVSRRPSTAYPDWAKTFDVVAADLGNDQENTKVCEDVKTVIHLAGASPEDCANNPLAAHRENVENTERLLISAMKAGVERFIYFSTAYVYGSLLEGTISESTFPKPTGPYAETNLAAEKIIRNALKSGKISGLVFRLSNVVGAPADPGVSRWSILVNDLCRQAVESGQLDLRSSGMQYRDFVAMNDVEQAVGHFLKLAPDNWEDGLFNLGGNNCLRVIDLAHQIADRCGTVLGYKPVITRPEPDPEDNQVAFHYSIDKIRRAGFEPESNLDGEIDATLELCRQVFSRN